MSAAQPAAAAQGVTLLPFQERVLEIPEQFDLVLAGGRGGSKTTTLVLLALRNAVEHESRARMLVLRQSFPALGDFLSMTRDLFSAAFGRDAAYNSNDHLWTLPGGATLELGFLSSEADYSRYQGRNFQWVGIDETQQWATPVLLDRMLSNLRGPRGVPTRFILAANPGGVGHGWLARRYCLRATPWLPDQCPDTGRRFVLAPSTLEDNIMIDQVAYRRAIEASCAADPELLKAWLEGNWAVLRGAFFSSVLDERKVAVDPGAWAPGWFETRSNRQRRWFGTDPLLRGDPLPYITESWPLFLAMDWGSAAPAVCYVVAESPGAQGPDGRYYAPRSLVLLDELHTADPANPAVGLGWTTSKLADGIRELCARWGVDPMGCSHVLDDACFAQHGHEAGSIAAELLSCGVRFQPARKGTRAAGWQRMRTLLQSAGEPDRPGLYVSRACGYWWETVPVLPRDPRKPDDVDTRAMDHGADACRMAITRQKLVWSSQPLNL